MSSFNLTEWALKHKQLVYFFIFLTFIGGFLSYNQLGRSEDPDFVIRQMVIATYWPGATARQIEDQITDKIEKKLQDTPGVDYIKSYSKPGEAVIFLSLRDNVKQSQVRPTWVEVRNMVNDIKHTLPEGTVGPFFNDRFDDVFGSIYALTGEGYSYEELREQAETIRRMLLGVQDVGKVELVGVQPEKIYIEMENSKMAQLGIDPNLIIYTLKAQNAMTPAGMVETSSDNVYLRVSGLFQNIEHIKNLSIRAAGRTFRLGDIAKVYRSYAEPAEPKMYFNGKPAVGIALAMSKGGNILSVGDELNKTVDMIENELPLGLEIHQVSDQPEVVKHSINEFIRVLAEAVIIVLAVSFLSLGVRTGVVVALCIPLVIAGVFVSMNMAGINLHKVSLGALIIALGLLVDDAIIAVEMMTVKLEEGWDKTRAACYAYTVTALPMLTGTLVTCAGFMPVAFSVGKAAEYVGSLFWVVLIALVISWVVAAVVTPLLGFHLIKVPQASSGQAQHDIYDTKFYRVFKKILVWCLHHRVLVIGITVASFACSLFLLRFVKEEFFPLSVRPELIVELRLPEGSSLKATEQEALHFGEMLKDDPDIINYVSYIGEGSPRFVLVVEPEMPKTNYAQFVILAKSTAARETIKTKVEKIFDESFPNVRGHAKVISNGPPSAYPVMFRVAGPNHEKVRELAEEVKTAILANPNAKFVEFDWYTKTKAMRLEVDQDKARMMGINSQQFALALQSQLSGVAIAEFRQNDKLVDMVFRLNNSNRNDLANIKNISVHIGNGRYVPVEQVAKISYEAEEGMIWRRNLKPTITVMAEVAAEASGNNVTKQVYASLSDLRSKLPPGYSISLAGSAEDSETSMKNLSSAIPAMIVIIMLLLMFQLQSIEKMVLVLLTVPFGIIGVTLGLLVMQRPIGFVAELGVMALSGMIIRNAVILIDQIDKHLAAGESAWDAIINSAILRFRPIMLTAAAAILGMVPLISSKFWGPMAVAIAGGLSIATALTLLVLPAMYAVWFKVKPDSNSNNDHGRG